MRDELRVEAESLYYLLRAEERGAHPARVEPAVVGGEKHVLRRRAERLDGHGGLALLAACVGVGVEVLEVQAQEDEDGRVEAAAASLEPPLDDLGSLAVHHEVGRHSSPIALASRSGLPS